LDHRPGNPLKVTSVYRIFNQGGLCQRF